ncbi:MAG: hypothetical protein A2X86_05425 [Bdellovibrionales bacterium GWA2_49_15]|nr:MAG: hypothetical protein A2X86_05425 [Bdellovibrionales bacterium GWA2_49_15]
MANEWPFFAMEGGVMYPQSQNTNSSLEIKYSKTNLAVPVWKGVQLHSLYDPMKEAENLIFTAFEPLRNKKNFLIFGLGFGHHITALLKKLADEGLRASIMVIEPEEEIYRKYLEIAETSTFEVIAGKSVNQLYNDQSFINFLCTKPGIIRHPASFNLHVNYFKELLSHRATNTVAELRAILELPEDSDLQQLLQGFAPDTHLFEIAKHDILEQDFFLIEMLNAISATVKESRS